MKMKAAIFIILWFSFTPFFTAFGQLSEENVPAHENPFHNEHIQHKALTQYFRWFQAFERELTERRIQNHLAILKDSVLFTTVNGPLQGKEGMLGFMNYVSSWKNSHHIEQVEVKTNNDGTIGLEAAIRYQNILPDGSQNEYKLHYSTKLIEIPNELPLFTEITLLPTETLAKPAFEDAYTENRSKSLVYYWMYLMDNAADNEGKIMELLAPEYRFNFDQNSVSNYVQLKKQLRKKRKKYPYTLHAFKNFKAKLNTDRTISISMDIVWKGINLKGEKMLEEMHHEWVLENNPDERFARIKEIIATPKKRI